MEDFFFSKEKSPGRAGCKRAVKREILFLKLT
jgi:hypothetical protein